MPGRFQPFLDLIMKTAVLSVVRGRWPVVDGVPGGGRPAAPGGVVLARGETGCHAWKRLETPGNALSFLYGSKNIERGCGDDRQAKNHDPIVGAGCAGNLQTCDFGATGRVFLEKRPSSMFGFVRLLPPFLTIQRVRWPAPHRCHQKRPVMPHFPYAALCRIMPRVGGGRGEIKNSKCKNEKLSQNQAKCGRVVVPAETDPPCSEATADAGSAFP